MKTIYVVLDKETNNWEIWQFDTYEEAINCITENEKEDKINWDYKADYYEIKEISK